MKGVAERLFLYQMEKDFVDFIDATSFKPPEVIKFLI